MSTFKFTARRANPLLVLTLGIAVFLAACAPQATAAPEPISAPVEATSAPANTEVPVANAPATEAIAPTEPAAPAAGTVSFSKDIQPILESRCVNCHGDQKVSKGLNMETYNGLMAGSDNGAVIVAGDASNSTFIKLIQSGKMPKRGPKVLPEQLQLLIDWINAGALNN